MNTFDDLPNEIKLTIIDKMYCSDIVKLFYINPNSHNIIQKYLNMNNFESIDDYILFNLNKYIEDEPETITFLLKYKHRMHHILFFFELGYYYQATTYCTIDDEHKFNNFIKLIRFYTHLQDPFDMVSNLEHHQADKLVLLHYNTTNLSLKYMYRFCYEFNDNQIAKCIEYANLGYSEKDIYDIVN